jgi:hypothetical protein
LLEGSWRLPIEVGPRVAAADEMLKRMMGRLEDDLDQQYVQPMLKGLRGELKKQGVFLAHQHEIEEIARRKYMAGRLERDGSVLIHTNEL